MTIRIRRRRHLSWWIKNFGAPAPLPKPQTSEKIWILTSTFQSLLYNKLFNIIIIAGADYNTSQFRQWNQIWKYLWIFKICLEFTSLVTMTAEDTNPVTATAALVWCCCHRSIHYLCSRFSHCYYCLLPDKPMTVTTSSTRMMISKLRKKKLEMLSSLAWTSLQFIIS